MQKKKIKKKSSIITFLSNFLIVVTGMMAWCIISTKRAPPELLFIYLFVCLIPADIIENPAKRSLSLDLWCCFSVVSQWKTQPLAALTLVTRRAENTLTGARARVKATLAFTPIQFGVGGRSRDQKVWGRQKRCKHLHMKREIYSTIAPVSSLRCGRGAHA